MLQSIKGSVFQNNKELFVTFKCLWQKLFEYLAQESNTLLFVLTTGGVIDVVSSAIYR